MYSTRNRTLMSISFYSRQLGRTEVRLYKMFVAVLKIYRLEFILFSTNSYVFNKLLKMYTSSFRVLY